MEKNASSSSDTSDIENLFITNYVYPSWFTERNYTFYKKLSERLDKLCYVHSQSAKHFDKLNKKIKIPSIAITALSSMLSFLSSSQYVGSNAIPGFAISVGILTSIAALLQSISHAYNFNTKSEAHRIAADEYNELRTKVQFEMEMPNEKDFVNKLEKKMITIQNKCKYYPPQFIIEAYDETHSGGSNKKAIIPGYKNSNSVNYFGEAELFPIENSIEDYNVNSIKDSIENREEITISIENGIGEDIGENIRTI